ncbi:MAG: FAD-dependent oxidoreductase [Bacteroidales bacterium]|nr:FAD-dependent oxidoreductase [Bacteroidales bacterium]
MGIDIRTRFKVNKVSREKSKLKVESLEGENLSFDYVISTLPSHLTAKIAPGLSKTEIQALNDIKYLGVACVSLLLKKEITPYYVTNITDSRVPFTGLIEMTALVDRKFFEGHSLLYLPKYVNSEDDIFIWDEDRFKHYFISELKKMNPTLMDEEIVGASAARARYVITLPEMGYSKKLQGFSTSILGFFIINSSYITDGTLNVNETLKVAKSWLPKVLNTVER